MTSYEALRYRGGTLVKRYWLKHVSYYLICSLLSKFLHNIYLQNHWFFSCRHELIFYVLYIFFKEYHDSDLTFCNIAIWQSTIIVCSNLFFFKPRQLHSDSKGQIINFDIKSRKRKFYEIYNYLIFLGIFCCEKYDFSLQLRELWQKQPRKIITSCGRVTVMKSFIKILANKKLVQFFTVHFSSPILYIYIYIYCMYWTMQYSFVKYNIYISLSLTLCLCLCLSLSIYIYNFLIFLGIFCYEKYDFSLQLRELWQKQPRKIMTSCGRVTAMKKFH